MAWTAAKRKSVQGYTPGLANPWPSGTIGVQARAAIAWLFSADSWPSAVAAVTRRLRGWAPYAFSRQHQQPYGTFIKRP